jgi:hypothetical protein
MWITLGQLFEELPDSYGPINTKRCGETNNRFTYTLRIVPPVKQTVAN